jgi:CRP/FNR family transcriptional regulator, dissimilatory nitrate respiration regulator
MQLGALAERCLARTLEPGETLFEEGAACSGLFIVTTGRIEVRQVSLRGREQILHTEGPGATLGEGPLLDQGGYIASAVALESSRLLFLPRADVLRLCRRHPEVALAIAEALARRMRHFAEMISDLTFHSVAERLARYLIETASVRHPSASSLVVDLQFTQAQLGARLGTVRELVARAFAELERAGIISRTDKRIVIRDRARLEAFALGNTHGEKPPSE